VLPEANGDFWLQASKTVPDGFFITRNTFWRNISFLGQAGSEIESEWQSEQGVGHLSLRAIWRKLRWLESSRPILEPVTIALFRIQTEVNRVQTHCAACFQSPRLGADRLGLVVDGCRAARQFDP
jgi:hypothetical protein